MGIRKARFAFGKKAAPSALAFAVFMAWTASATAQPAPSAAPSPQGVLTHEIILGTHVDLSGPLAPWGAAVRNGLTLAIEDANKAGGVNGRTIRLIVKDDAYDPAQAASAVRQLVTQERVFAILSPLGTHTPTPSLQEALSRGVLYLFPLTPSQEAHTPLEPLKFALTPTYEMEVQEGLRRILNARGPMKVAVLAPNDGLGRAVAQGAVNEMARRGLALGGVIPFARGSVRYETIVSLLSAEAIDLLVLGVEPEEALALLRTTRLLRRRPLFLCTSACYVPEFATLGATDAEGLFAIGHVPIPYADDPKLRPWVKRYEARFSSVASVQALTAYRNARYFFAVLRQAGRLPTQEGVASILETRGSWTDPQLGGLPIEFSPSDHLGGHSGLLAQVRNRRWVLVSDDLISALR
jgi:ABC-type branched-subunit amino acid transport system substrate-binding protein